MICRSYEGCHGTGEVTDLTDSGSGRMVYCSCDAGVLLCQKDEADFRAAARQEIRDPCRECYGEGCQDCDGQGDVPRKKEFPALPHPDPDLR